MALVIVGIAVAVLGYGLAMGPTRMYGLSLALAAIDTALRPEGMALMISWFNTCCRNDSRLVSSMPPSAKKRICGSEACLLDDCVLPNSVLALIADRAVSLATNFPVIVLTGIYREPWVPQWAQPSHGI
jgi:hypothetical protein